MRNLIFKIIIFSGLFIQPIYAQHTEIKGFVNVDATAIFDTISKKNRLALGQYDLFITSQINEKVSFLGETVFEYGSGSGFNVGVERAIINYRIKDYFFLTIGKQYTPLGYWNNAYHHGLVLQPTITRPTIVREEDNGGGWLPLEDVAFQINGEGITKWNLGYNIMLGNGISSNIINDYTASKAICINLHAEPIENLKFFLSGYNDIVPSGTKTLQGITLTNKTNLEILNASVAYMDGAFPLEFIGEFYNLKTQMMDTTTTAASNGFLLYAGYKLRKFKLTPYVVYDKVLLDKKEMYFSNNNTSSITIGFRYVMHPLSAIKLEFKSINTKNLGDQYRVDLQFAIGF